jgi:hypothetical protein
MPLPECARVCRLEPAELMNAVDLLANAAIATAARTLIAHNAVHTQDRSNGLVSHTQTSTCKVELRAQRTAQPTVLRAHTCNNNR